MSRRLDLPAFQRLFTTFTRSAWRWECQGEYHPPYEREPFQRFLNDDPVDDVWMRPWLEAVEAKTAAGARFERVRLLTEPLTDYLRFEMDTALRCNIPAGEDIRVLFPEQAEHLGLPHDDFWIFDDTAVAHMHFNGDGMTHADLITGEDITPYLHVKRLAWQHAQPCEHYQALL